MVHISETAAFTERLHCSQLPLSVQSDTRRTGIPLGLLPRCQPVFSLRLLRNKNQLWNQYVGQMRQTPLPYHTRVHRCSRPAADAGVTCLIDELRSRVGGQTVEVSNPFLPGGPRRVTQRFWFIQDPRFIF